jgi:hypothetical protein
MEKILAQAEKKTISALKKELVKRRGLYRFVRSPSGEVYETFLPQGVVEDLFSELH